MLIDPTGAYLHTIFTGNNGTWHLIGSEDNGPVMQTLDTFKSDQGKYTTVTRSEVKQWYGAKKNWL